MATATSLGKMADKTPLYFFYDSEATDRDVKVDKIIEVAAIVHTNTLTPRAKRELTRSASHEFSSLCFCDRELGEVPQKLIGLTKKDLKDEPPLEEVLKRFFEWMEESIATANRLDHEEYTPVLVAHSGNMLDFPLLLQEVDRSPLLNKKYSKLNIRFVDTFYVFKHLKRSMPSYNYKLRNLALKNLYQTFLHEPYKGHRALADARALCQIFTEGEPAKDIGVFKKYTLDRKEMTAVEEDTQKFKKASIYAGKSADLLAKGITYDTLVRQYQRSPMSFQAYLRSTCGINPKPEVIQYFRAHH